MPYSSDATSAALFLRLIRTLSPYHARSAEARIRGECEERIEFKGDTPPRECRPRFTLFMSAEVMFFNTSTPTASFLPLYISSSEDTFVKISGRSIFTDNVEETLQNNLHATNRYIYQISQFIY